MISNANNFNTIATFTQVTFASGREPLARSGDMPGKLGKKSASMTSSPKPSRQQAPTNLAPMA